MSETELIKNLFPKKSHWVPGYNAAVLTLDGMKVAEDFDTWHPAIPGGGNAYEVPRGLYNPQTHHLIILSTPDDARERNDSDTWPEMATQGELHTDQKAYWLAEAERAGIPVSKTDFLWVTPDLQYEDLYEAIRGGGFHPDQYVLDPDPRSRGLRKALQPVTPPKSQPMEQLNLFSNVSRLRDVLK